MIFFYHILNSVIRPDQIRPYESSALHFPTSKDDSSSDSSSQACPADRGPWSLGRSGPGEECMGRNFLFWLVYWAPVSWQQDESTGWRVHWPLAGLQRLVWLTAWGDHMISTTWSTAFPPFVLFKNYLFVLSVRTLPLMYISIPAHNSAVIELHTKCQFSSSWGSRE